VNIIGVIMRYNGVISRYTKVSGGGNRTGSPAFTEGRRSDHQRFRFRGPAAQEADSRQSDWQAADQRRDTSRLRYNMNQQQQKQGSYGDWQ